MFDETKNNGENRDIPETSCDNSENTVFDNMTEYESTAKTENLSESIEEASEQLEEASSENEENAAQNIDMISDNKDLQNDNNIQEPVIYSRTTDSFSETAYSTKSADGNVTNGYEWNSNAETESKGKKKKNKSSGTGFKVFVAIMLTVFTVSSLLLAAMVTLDIVTDNDFSFSIVNKEADLPAETAPEKQEFDYNAVTLDNPNYVAFDFKEHEGQVLSIPEVAAKCSPSSVGIVSEIETSYTYPFYFSPTTRVAEASGSGFIYSSDGYIITNHHVIEDAKRIRVILHDNKEFEAELIGSDALSDIAVLKIAVDESTKLIPMEIGNSDELVVGEAVVAIGCPAGIEFIGTVTDGIVSSINRNIEITDDYGNVQKTMTLIQTNATINHGNSGGPLINTKGQVIGINTLKLSADYEGVGFSIPMNGAVPVIKQLIEHGKVVERTEEDFAYGKGVIGITGSAISEDEAEYYNIPQGVLVVNINREGSAAKAGLRRGDIITHYNGKEVKTVDDINAEKGSARAGTPVTVTIYRDGDNNSGETIDISFKLDAQ